MFKVQSDIAGKVADALNVALGAGEQDALRQRPTENLPAYDAYLQGEAARAASADPDSYRRAAAHYQDAVNRDPAFALAWARLAGIRSSLYAYGTPDPAIARGAMDALARARSLAPASTATAMAEYAVGSGSITTRRRRSPRSSRRWRPRRTTPCCSGWSRGRSSRRRLAPAREHAERAVALDPRTPLAFATLGDVDARLGRWADARATIDRAQSLERGNLLLVARRVEAHLLEGDLESARRALAEASAAVDHARVAAYVAAFANIGWVLSDADRRLVLGLPVAAFDGNTARRALVRAEIRGWTGDTAAARVLGDSAARLFRRQLAGAPRDASLHADLGLALAYAGRFPEAIAEGERAIELLPVARDFVPGSEMRFDLVRILVRAGQRDRALTLLEPLVREPYYISPAWLRIDPDLAPLRGIRDSSGWRGESKCAVKAPARVARFVSPVMPI